MRIARTRRSGRVSETIASRITEQISSGALRPGEKLPAERDMAERFRTSRVSVREAYRSLEELGLLTIRRGAEGGAFITDLDHKAVVRSFSLMLRLGKTTHAEIAEACLLVEPPIARLAARRARADDLARLTKSSVSASARSIAVAAARRSIAISIASSPRARATCRCSR